MNNGQNKYVTRREFIKASAAIGTGFLEGGWIKGASQTFLRLAVEYRWSKHKRHRLTTWTVGSGR